MFWNQHTKCNNYMTQLVSNIYKYQQYFPIFTNICQYFHISANIGLFIIVKSKVCHVLESADQMQQLDDTIGQ